MKIQNGWERICVLSAFCVATAIVSPAQTFTVIKRFNGTNGGTPFGPVVQGVDGNIYGATTSGGANNGGTIFRLTPAGALTTLYSFCALASCTDGSSPLAGLMQVAGGAFYGTTQVGGANGVGTVFRITPGAPLTTIYNFCPLTNCPDGAQPFAGLIQGADGSFYGTTNEGGANGNAGTVFKITPGGALTTIHSFCASAGCTDGSFPRAVLVQGSDAKFYGTTGTDGANGRGTVFKVSPLTGALTTLYAFCAFAGCADGSGPVAGVVEGKDGNYYGTTGFGGITNTNCPSGCGTVFKITPEGTLTTLHSFDSSDGAIPLALVRATDDNLYGTTELGGSSNKGTIFQITPSGTLTTLHSFSSTDGDQPESGLMQDTDGTFYGTTELGGTEFNVGTVYHLSTGLGPFVKTLPMFAAAGATVRILGTNLTNATSVTFNGTPATFSVVSATEVSATVPAGATDGQVQVTTPSGTLTSNVAFVVL
jgi:uncharacterized repeat protein (TIGR03803 family)